MNKRFLLFLTACVNPKGMIYTVVQDENIRLQQYIVALKWYLENTDFPILFVENSGWDISSFFYSEIEKGRLEILTFQGNNYDSSLGKGYGEALIIQYGFDNSNLLRHTDMVIKITGRLICMNIMKVAKQCLRTDTLYVNLYLNDKKQIISKSQFFVAPVAFIKKYFLPRKNDLNDSLGYYFEHLLYDARLSWIKDGARSEEFKIYIWLKGQSGTSGKEYTKPSFANQRIFVKYYIHRIVGYYGSLNPFCILRILKDNILNN